MLKWLEPRKIRLSNTKYPDRLTSWLSEPLVASQKFIDIYSIEGLTGINLFEPIEVVKVAHKTKNSADPPMYFRAQIDYTQSVRVDAGKTRIHGQESGWSCELCNPWGCTVDHIETLVLDTTNWDGIDIFRVYAIGRVVVSQRFHDAIQKYGLTNFNLVTVEDYRF